MMELEGNRHRIGRWVRELFAEGASENEPDRFVVRHISMGDRQADVASVALPEKVDEAALDKVVARIDEAIDRDTDGLGGVQRYAVFAMKETRTVGRLPLRAFSGGEEAGLGESLESEPPNARGLVAQLMRHTELKERMFAMSIGQVFSTMQRMMTNMELRLERADSARLRAVDAAEQMLTQDHERAVMVQKLEDDRATKAAFFKMASSVLPLLVGGKLGGGSSPVDGLVARLFSTIRPEQAEKLAEVLTPEQMSILQQIAVAAQAGGDPAAEAGDEGAGPVDGAGSAARPGGAR